MTALNPVRTYGDVFPHFYYDLFIWTAFFYMAFYAIQTVIHWVFPRFVANMANDSARRDYVNYWFSLLNHIPVVTLVLIRILYHPTNTFMATMSDKHAYLTAQEKDDDQDFYSCESAAYITGYFVSDLFIYVIPMALEGDFTYLFHHGLTIFVGCIVPYIPRSFAKHCTRVVSMEISSILLTVRAIYKHSGFTNKRVIKAMEYGFAGTFFLVRVYSILYMLIELGIDIRMGETHAPFFAKVVFCVFAALWGLQVWWFQKILAKY